MLHDSGDDDWDAELLAALAGCLSRSETIECLAAMWLLRGVAEFAGVLSFRSSRDAELTSAVRPDDDLIVRTQSLRTPVSVLFDPTATAALFASDGFQSSDVRTVTVPGRPVAFGWVAHSGGDRHAADHLKLITESALLRSESPVREIPDPNLLEAVAEYAAGAGHEVNNPLGAIIGQAARLLKTAADVESADALSTIGAQAWRIRDMIGDSMVFGRPPQPEMARFDLSAAVREVVSACESDTAERVSSVEWQVRVPDACFIRSDQNMVSDILTRLLRNSRDAVAEVTGSRTIRIRVTHENSACVLRVEDNGPGVRNEQARQHLWNPFYSGRQAGRGLGFGLSVCYRLTRVLGGLILADPPDADRHGFAVTVVLPADLSESG